MLSITMMFLYTIYMKGALLEVLVTTIVLPSLVNNHSIRAIVSYMFVVMGLRSERSGMGKAMVDMVTREVTRHLQQYLVRENISLNIKPCQTPEQVPNGPLVVLCLNMSRVGANIQDALLGLKGKLIL